MTALIRLRDVSIGYRRPFLPPITLDIDAGQVLGVVGPNGGGKSTLVRTLCGITRSLGGRIEYPQGRRPRIGYVPQREALDDIYPFSAREIVALSLVPGLRWFQRLRARHFALADEWLDRLGVATIASTPFRQLSYGQRQRVQLAAALVIDPEVLVLDEPDAALDPGAEERMLALVRALWTARGMAVVFVSHQLATTAAIATRLIIVDKDRGLFRSGPTSDIVRPEVLTDIYGAPAQVWHHDGRVLITFRGSEGRDG